MCIRDRRTGVPLSGKGYARSGGQTLAAAVAARGDDAASALRGHACAKAVTPLADELGGLIGALHLFDTAGCGPSWFCLDEQERCPVCGGANRICAGAIGHLLSVERDSDCAGDDESIAAVALFEQWKNRLPQLLRYAHHGRGLAALGCGEDLDYCARIDSVNVVPLQVQPGVLTAAALDG